MKLIGLTGGIGSGKSTVCKILQDRYGVPVYYADLRAKELMVEDHDVRSKVESLFGAEAYTDGVLNRRYISSKAFSDKSLLEKLNLAVHGAVQADFKRWVEEQKATYVVCEAAILIESGWSNDLDLVVVVQAPMEMRINRVMKRDGVSREQVEARMSCQLSDEKRIEYADIIVTADESCPIEELVENLQKKLTI